jgi:tRNA 5-methylaminomethyl-2-thiouridine biosynthesis bifunctional protein
MLRKQQMTADSVYLDGFSPQLNPEMWDEDAMKNIARHCRRGTRLATWCVAGHVRQALKAQGFEVKKRRRAAQAP